MDLNESAASRLGAPESQQATSASATEMSFSAKRKRRGRHWLSAQLRRGHKSAEERSRNEATSYLKPPTSSKFLQLIGAILLLAFYSHLTIECLAQDLQQFNQRSLQAQQSVQQEQHVRNFKPEEELQNLQTQRNPLTVSDSYGSRLPDTFPIGDNQFANRQGQLSPPTSGGERRPQRQQQQQQSPRVNQQPARQQQQAASGRQQVGARQAAGPLAAQSSSNIEQTLPVSQQDPFRAPTGELRFQRLRTPPGGEFPGANQAGSQLVPMPPPPPQFTPNQVNRQPQQQQNNNNGQNQNAGSLPTLTAFDLSSLANLANQPQFGSTQQQPSPFRRNPPPQQQQQQQRLNQNNGNNFQANFQANQVPNSPAQQQQSAGNNNNNGFNGNPFVANPQTELPFVRQVFRPTEQELPVSPEGERASSRPTPPPLFVPSRPLVNKVSRLVESGFSPIQPQGGAPLQQPPASNNAAREVFFEPTNQQRPSQAPQRNRQEPVRQQQQQQQPSRQSGDQTERRKPAMRRPSQRPQLPTVTGSRAPATADVIRAAANAIQAANEGLAAISTQGDSRLTASGETAATETPTRVAPQTTTEQVRVAPMNFGAVITNSEAPITTTAASETASTRRAILPPRSSANFFTLASLAATSAPTSFSPALPINAAVAASGSRRRIPVRNPQQQLSSSLRPQTTTPSLLQTTTTAATTSTSALPVTTIRQQPPTTTTAQSVRRPEIEEFYETIASGPFSSTLNAATTIDGFGAPSRLTPSQSSSTPATSGTSTTSGSTTEQSQAPTTLANDLYGSRLTGNVQPVEQPAEIAPLPPATESSRNKPRQREQQVQQPQQSQPEQQPSQAPVMVPVTYMTTLTYLTTVLHGTHTLETSHESLVKSTELATLNAQLMDQIEHRLPLVEPTATLSVSSKTKGKGTTIVNLKSAVSAYNQELVEALGVSGERNTLQTSAPPTLLLTTPEAPAGSSRPAASQQQFQFLQPARADRKTFELSELERARKSLLTEYVYLYTMRPLGNSPDPSIDVTSVRSELVAPEASVAEPIMSELLANSNARLIDSNGLLRVNQEPASVNLGSTVGGNGASLTEVNMNVATYIKFQDISNAFVDVRPSRAAAIELTTSSEPQPPTHKHSLLDTSFNVHLALSNAIDKLDNLQASATPTLDSLNPSPRPTRLDSPDLLRSSGGTERAASMSIARSQLRSRVASSRFRSPVQSIALPPQSSSSQAQAPASVPPPSVAPSTGGSRILRPVKSRIVRPKSSQQQVSSDLPISSVSLAPVATEPNAQGTLAPTRTSKPRFVVVTRTGQFGIRAPAISSLASVAAAAEASSSVASSQQQVEPAQTVRVSSRFSKPSRFRGSIRASSRQQDTVTATPTVEADQQPTQPSVEQDLTRGSTASSEATSTTNQNIDSNNNIAANENKDSVASGSSNLQPEVDPSASVVVTYFTTTTHTIPFTINSETIFTTIEETNSRIATEYMRDLSSHFIEPTPLVTSQVIQATATTTTMPPTNPTDSTTQESQSTMGNTAAPPQQQTTTTDNSSGNKQPAIEPSFVVALNTRTYFTTFTYFTTYSAGSASSSVKSSESTTSNVVVETVSSMLEPTSVLPESPALTSTLSAMESSSSSFTELTSSSLPSQEILTTKTLLSTMTFYGTLYNGTETSLTPILDVSTQVLTLSSPAFNLNSEVLSDSSVEQVQSIVPTLTAEMPRQTVSVEPSATVNSQMDQAQSASNSDQITRTRSVYTTLTHFITFYSGTKTQLSTIQEISPTVLTEYIDRTLFEQQQQQTSDQLRDSSSVLVVPSLEAGSNQVIVALTPSPVLPELTATATAASEQPQVDNNWAGPKEITTTTTSAAPTTTTSSTTERPDEIKSSSSEMNSAAADLGSAPQSTTVGTLTSSEVASGELESVQVNGPRAPSSDNQSLGVDKSAEAKTLASTDEVEGKQSATNIIELSDLIASNNTQNGRVALAGNLGAAIKDIVQLLAGNKTNTLSPLGTQPVEIATEQAVQTSTTSAMPPTTVAQMTTQQQQQSISGQPKRPAGKLFGQKGREQLMSIQGSISSPTLVPTSSNIEQASSSSRPTPELSSQMVSKSSMTTTTEPQAAATIFFGDDGGDERRKQIKTVWPASQSTVFVTSIEPSTRSLTVTTTKVYYTRDAPITITSSFTTVIAPRTFVSTIMGTRTLVNQLNTQTVQPAILDSKQVKAVQSSRQDNQAAGHRLSVQQKQQKQQAQIDQQQKKQQQQQLAATSKPPRVVEKQNEKQAAAANINQCQPMCKLSNNEICKFTPNSDTSGAQGSFSCACRPGYYMAINSVGQRQCQEVQSYVVLLRLLQMGDQQVSFKKELLDRSSSEYKQFSRVVKDHVKRAYMTSDLTRDRFIGADITNYARSLSVASSASSTSASAQPIAGKQPVANVSGMLNDQLNAGIIVNITVQLQPPASSSEALDESMLKEELAKKLNLRQAAALAAAAAAGSQPAVGSSSKETVDEQASGSNGTTSEPLPNPNALFLADVEMVTDLDECANPALNDCHSGAVCINEPGSYKCDCREYPDLNPLHPGRQCASELKSCDYCNNRGDCIRMPSLHSSATNATNSNKQTSPSQSTVCQCHRIYLGRRCEINGLLLATLLPIVAILLIISVCLIIYCCRRWRKRSAMSKGFRNIGTFGPNIIGSTLDRKAMLESSSESSDTHQRSHHLRNAANGIYDTHNGIPSDPSSSSNESSPRQMVRNQMVDGGLLPGGSGYHLSPHLGERQQQQSNSSLGPYCSSIPPQIVIPRARHNQVNYAVHRGQVYMW